MVGNNNDMVIANNAALGALELDPSNSEPSEKIGAEDDQGKTSKVYFL